MIELRSLTKRFGDAYALDGLNLQARSGQIALLTGANGAGKSTALKIAAGVLRESDGAVAFDREAQSAAKRRRLSAYLPQGAGFHPRLNARQILAFYARSLGVPKQRVQSVLAYWGLDDAHARKPTLALSGGLRQRLGLAVLGLADCRFLLLDEPGLSLDPEWRLTMQVWLRQQADAGKTILVASHLTGEWNGKTDVCFLFKDGRADRRLDPNRLLDSNPAEPSPSAALK